MNIAKITPFLSVALTATLVAVTTWAAEFYVDSFATPGGNGALSAPFQSIQEGINSLKPGDTLLIRGDMGAGRIYFETPTFPVSGEKSAPITVQSVPGEKVIVSTPEKISLNKNFLLIKGLIFDHQNAEIDAIGWSADNIVLSECEIRNGSRDGIDISARASNVTISNCLIHDFIWVTPVRKDAHCIVANPGATGLRITGNKIFNCSGDGIQLYANDSTPVSSYVKNVLVEGNIIYSILGSNSENALDFKGGVDVIVKHNDIYGFTSNKAVVVQKGAQNVRLEENVIHDSARGVEFRREGGHFQQDITVIRNVLFNITGQYALKFDGVFDAKVLHNTVYNSIGNSIRVEGEGIKRGMIKNNLIHLSGRPRISKTFSADYSHNGWFRSSAGALASSQDTTGTDPLFVDAAAKDFRLISKSPAIDKGIHVGLPYAGLAPDLGAFELTENVLPVSPSPMVQ